MTVRIPGPERLGVRACLSFPLLKGRGFNACLNVALSGLVFFVFVFFPPFEFGLRSRVRLGLGREGALCSLFVTLKRRALAVSLAFLGEI